MVGDPEYKHSFGQITYINLDGFTGAIEVYIRSMINPAIDAYNFKADITHFQSFYIDFQNIGNRVGINFSGKNQLLLIFNTGDAAP